MIIQTFDEFKSTDYNLSKMSKDCFLALKNLVLLLLYKSNETPICTLFV